MSRTWFRGLTETLQWRRGECELIPEYRQLWLRPCRPPLQAYVLSFPPGPSIQGQPVYVWFANAFVRGDRALLAVIRDFGPLLGPDVKWRCHKEAAGLLHLSLRVAYAIQHRDGRVLQEIPDVVSMCIEEVDAAGRGSRSDEDRFRDIEEGLAAEPIAGRGRWQSAGWLLEDLLRSVAISPQVSVGDQRGPLLSSVFGIRDLQDVAELALVQDLLTGALLMRCGNERCKRNPLFRTFRSVSRYCSRHCQNAVMQRRHRERRASS